MITIFDSSDLSFAIQYSRVLKLQILMTNPKEDASAMKSLDFNNIKQHLRLIRDTVTKLIDTLDSKGPQVSSSTEEGLTDLYLIIPSCICK